MEITLGAVVAGIVCLIGYAPISCADCAIDTERFRELLHHFMRDAWFVPADYQR